MDLGQVIVVKMLNWATQTIVAFSEQEEKLLVETQIFCYQEETG